MQRQYLLFPSGRPMTRAQERMFWRVRENPGYRPSRSSTKRTAKILVERKVLEGDLRKGLRVRKDYVLARKRP